MVEAATEGAERAVAHTAQKESARHPTTLPVDWHSSIRRSAGPMTAQSQLLPNPRPAVAPPTQKYIARARRASSLIAEDDSELQSECASASPFGLLAWLAIVIAALPISALIPLFVVYGLLEGVAVALFNYPLVGLSLWRWPVLPGSQRTCRGARRCLAASPPPSLSIRLAARAPSRGAESHREGVQTVDGPDCRAVERPAARLRRPGAPHHCDAGGDGASPPGGPLAPRPLQRRPPAGRGETLN